MGAKMVSSIILVLTFVFHSCSGTSLLWVSLLSGKGDWQLLQENIGISAMHMQLMSNNKVIIFDRTDFGPSNLSLSWNLCRHDPQDTFLPDDCTAHSVLYDIDTNTFRPLMVQTDTWCSSGSLLPNGTLVQTGGFNDGEKVVRTFEPCIDDLCNWIEHPGYLATRRWYATNQILPDGRIIIVGGRRQFNYEFYPRSFGLPSTPASTFSLDLLRETSDDDENNLYPFVHLLPDGNLFIFANTRAIVLDYKRNLLVRELPAITGGDPRNYPSSGSSVLLPIDENNQLIKVEIMICGGAPRGSFSSARNGSYMRASDTCGRIIVSDMNPNWTMETMPLPRVMGDMALLPNGDVIIINGAGTGTAGWENAQDPVTRPVIYRPNGTPGDRFSVMSPSSRPRLYHSAVILLPDGRILVGGSNPHVFYNFTGVLYPTDLSLEAFSPPYLADVCDSIRPTIINFDTFLGYGQLLSVTFSVPQFLKFGTISVRIVAPAFATHALGMNQRMVLLRTIQVFRSSSDSIVTTAVGPSTAEVAPPGYYMLFLVHAGVPSSGVWVKLQ